MTVTTKTLGTCVCTFDDATGELVIGAGTLPEWNNSSIYGKMGIDKDDVISVKASDKVILPAKSGYLFYQCANMVKADVTGFDTSKVTNMSSMFGHCYNLTSIDVTGFDTSNVTNMSYMFGYCRELTSIDVSGFDTSNVTDMRWMFSYCNKLTSIDVSGFDTSNVTDMRWMFGHCYNLTSIDVTGFDTSKVTDMSYMFYSCDNLTSIDVTGFDTSKVTNMSNMFFYCYKLTSIDVTGFDTSKVTDMSSMFSYCNKLTSIDVSGFDTSNVTDMSNMFFYCYKLTSIDVTGFDTSNVTNMSYMFGYCRELTSIDVTGFDTSKVTNMSYMFYYCCELTSIDVTGFDTSKVTNMSSMFYYCNKLMGFTLGAKFETSQITDPAKYYNISIASTAPATNTTNQLTVNSDSEFMALTTEQKAGTWKLKVPITAVFSAANNHTGGLTVSCTYSGATGTATLGVSYANIGSTVYTDGGTATSTSGTVTLTNEAAPTNALNLLLWLSDDDSNVIYYRTTTAAATAIMTLDGEGNLTVASSVTGTDIEATGNLTVSGTGTFSGVNGSTNEFIVYAAQTSATQCRWIFTNAGNIRMEKSTDYGGTWTTQGWYACDIKAARSLLDGVYPVGAVYISYVSTSPAELFGGTWTQITGRFLRMANDVSTGGADSHTLSTNEMPSHNHGTNVRIQWYNNAGYGIAANWTTSNLRIDAGTIYTTSTGDNAAHNNMPAYQDLYAWRRTA